MVRAKSGDTVKVHYTGRLDDGTVFGSSNGRKPMQFVIGKNSTISGLKEAVVGMEPGESKTAKIVADKAFGPRLKKAVKVVNRKKCPEDLELGQKLEMTDKDIQTTVVKVIEISESKVTLDTNHTLAGEDLTLDIELLEIL
ncbi:MAG: FKBP-type peptidyl-prolyl cis-trans isomerase [Planctomycetota bacterium]|jgi:peptidylprolyl isomerase